MAVRKTFKGGVHPHEYKELSCSKGSVEMPAPSRVVVPLRQHLGAPAKAVVNVGDRVVEGQVIGEPGGFVSAPVHAPIAGEVTAVAKHRHPGGFVCDAIVIEAKEPVPGPDGNVPVQVPYRMPAAVGDRYMEADPALLKNLIRDAGLVGMGGAAFPTHVKLSPPAGKPVDTLVINGAECEPFDRHRVMEETEKVVHGVLFDASLASNAARRYRGQQARRHRPAFGGLCRRSGVVPAAGSSTRRAAKSIIKALTGREVTALGTA